MSIGLDQGGDGGPVQELKFSIPARRHSATLASLTQILGADPSHPDNWVNTVYFDNTRLDSLGEKLNGDSLKRKVRLRWYEEVAGGAPSAPFLEVKLRQGRLRRKLRAPAPLAGGARLRLALEHPSWIDLPRRVAPPEFRVAAGLRPTVLVRYRRRRFVHRHGGDRIALDFEIGATACHRGLLPDAELRPLRDSILEVKTATHVSAHLAALIRALDGTPRSISKYAACLGLS